MNTGPSNETKVNVPYMENVMLLARNKYSQHQIVMSGR
jgi:hypothetical protein